MRFEPPDNEITGGASAYDDIISGVIDGDEAAIRTLNEMLELGVTSIDPGTPLLSVVATVIRVAMARNDLIGANALQLLSRVLAVPKWCFPVPDQLITRLVSCYQLSPSHSLPALEIVLSLIGRSRTRMQVALILSDLDCVSRLWRDDWELLPGDVLMRLWSSAARVTCGLLIACPDDGAVRRSAYALSLRFFETGVAAAVRAGSRIFCAVARRAPVCLPEELFAPVVRAALTDDVRVVSAALRLACLPEMVNHEDLYLYLSESNYLENLSRIDSTEVWGELLYFCGCMAHCPPFPHRLYEIAGATLARGSDTSRLNAVHFLLDSLEWLLSTKELLDWLRTEHVLALAQLAGSQQSQRVVFMLLEAVVGNCISAGELLPAAVAMEMEALFDDACLGEAARKVAAVCVGMC